MKDIGVLTIHGIGNDNDKFDDPFREKLEGHLKADFNRLAIRRAHWSPEVSGEQTDVWKRIEKGPGASLRWDFARKFFMNYFADSLAYQRYGYKREPDSTYERIQDVVHRELRSLREELGGDKPLVVLAYSLGGYITTSYTWDRQHWKEPVPDPRGDSAFTRMETLAGLVTFGCNLPFFAFGAKPRLTIDFPGKALAGSYPATAAAARWQNYYDADDVLGWPIHEVYEGPAATIACIDDYPINVGIPIIQSGTPLSHIGYWKDQSFVKPVAEYLRTLLGTVAP
ncbi:MAG: hypothetical protein IV100_26530 [Myxococcales bacterium]|nr:hypothetical protein [Myxococcales bacterium]